MGWPSTLVDLLQKKGHKVSGRSPVLSNSPGKLPIAQLVPGGRCAHNTCTGGGLYQQLAQGRCFRASPAAGEPECRGQPAEPGSCVGTVRPWPAQLLKQQQWSPLRSPECAEDSCCDLHLCTQVCN